jgi:hypothetical protein
LGERDGVSTQLFHASMQVETQALARTPIENIHYLQELATKRETIVDEWLKFVEVQFEIKESALEASEGEVKRLLAVEVASRGNACAPSARETEPLDERVPGLSDNALTKLQVASRQNTSRKPSSLTKFSSFTL